MKVRSSNSEEGFFSRRKEMVSFKIIKNNLMIAIHFALSLPKAFYNPDSRSPV